MFTMDSQPSACAFDALFAMNVPHVIEMIFLSLDYASLKECCNVSTTCKKHLKSESFRKRAQSVFEREIVCEEEKFWTAVKSGRAIDVKRVLSGGMMNVNNVKPPRGRLSCVTPLTEAAWKGHTNVFKVLLDEGADVDKAENYRRTPLIVAATMGNEIMVRHLLEKGANIHIVDKDGWTPLRKATYWGHKNVVKLKVVLVYIR